MRYMSAHEIEGLDAYDLRLCLDTDDSQHDYDGSRQTDDQEPGDGASMASGLPAA